MANHPKELRKFCRWNGGEFNHYQVHCGRCERCKAADHIEDLTGKIRELEDQLGVLAKDVVDGIARGTPETEFSLWPCGCNPWSSLALDYCPEHRLTLGSPEQRIASTKRYLADLEAFGETEDPPPPPPGPPLKMIREGYPPKRPQ